MWSGFLILSVGSFVLSWFLLFGTKENGMLPEEKAPSGKVFACLCFFVSALFCSGAVYAFLRPEFAGNLPVSLLISLAGGFLSSYFLTRIFLHYRRRRREKRLLSPVQLCTVGVFFAVVFLFLPIYYLDPGARDGFTFLRPLLLSIHNSFRVFILDGDFQIITDALVNQPEPFRATFSLYAAVLYVAAPLLTFGNLLSLFKNIWGEIRYRVHRYSEFYIMSELNVKSVALARSIREEKPKAVLVFTDVFEQNEEGGYELLSEARSLNAICFKKDVSHLDVVSKKGPVEIFLIGENEAENVSQAVRITSYLNRKNTKQNVKILWRVRSVSLAEKESIFPVRF